MVRINPAVLGVEGMLTYYVGYYFRFVGLLNLGLLIGFTVPHTFFVTIPQYWLELWTDSSGENTAFFICGFLFLSFMSWTTTNGIMWSTIIRLAPQSGLRFHQRLLDIVTGYCYSSLYPIKGCWV